MIEERKPKLERPVTPFPDETLPVKGGSHELRKTVANLPKTGDWYECAWPFSATTSAAFQAAQRARVYWPAYEFRVRKRSNVNKVWVRYRADETE